MLFGTTPQPIRRATPPSVTHCYVADFDPIAIANESVKEVAQKHANNWTGFLLDRHNAFRFASSAGSLLWSTLRRLPRNATTEESDASS